MSIGHKARLGLKRFRQGARGEPRTTQHSVLGLGQLDANPSLIRIPTWYAICMSQIAVRLTDEELKTLDSAVAEGTFRTRAEAVRAGIRLLNSASRDARIAASYRNAYAAPLTEDETEMLDAAAALAGEALA